MRSSGFSLFEVIIVVAILIAVVVIIVPSYRGFGSTNNLAVATDAVAQGLNQAQTLARSGEQGSDWGVHIATGRIIVFSGTDFTNREQSLDQIFTVPSNISSIGINELIFFKFTGLPQQIGEVILTNEFNRFKIITINEQGSVSYE
ncbi:MAG: hypothetical protein ABH822_01115 [Patescibacteria group bacterium]